MVFNTKLSISSKQGTMLYSFSWVNPRSLNSIRRCFGTSCLFHLHGRYKLTAPVKMKQTGCSETSAHQIQTPGNHPKERIQHSEQGESLKSRRNKERRDVFLYFPSRSSITCVGLMVTQKVETCRLVKQLKS